MGSRLELTKRLEEFRSNNTEENTVLNYFDEQEIHPVPITVDSNNLQAVLDVIISKIGKPHNYGPTPEQIAEKRRILEEAKVMYSGGL
jgi:adenylate kinase